MGVRGETGDGSAEEKERQGTVPCLTVTHVLVDDPTKGYGIFAETMLDSAQKVGDGVLDVPQAENLKEAS